MKSTSSAPSSKFAAQRRACLLAVGCLALAWPCSASTNTDLGYTRVQVYSAALRYLRIDLGYEITEQDADAAYLLFRYKAEGLTQARFGAFEIVETAAGVRLWVKLPEMPSYHEQMLKDGLVKKLKQDYGEPPPKSVAPSSAPNAPSKTPAKPSTPTDGVSKPKTPQSKS